MDTIYALINLKNGKKYIGSTCNFSRRKAMHLIMLRNNNHHSPILQNSWNKYGSDCFKFTILEQSVDNKKRFEREQYYMDLYNSYNNKYGYNICEYAHSPHRDKNKKPVYQFDMNGIFIAKFESCTEASRTIGKANSSIHGCANGKFRYSHGFIWDYNEKLDYKRIILANSPIKRSRETREKMSKKALARTNQRKPILQYDLDGNFIKEWESTTALIKEKGYSNGYISDCLHNKHKKAYNYVWKFKNKDT